MSVKIKAKIKERYNDYSKEELLEELAEKIIELEKAKRELKKYKNPHTPSSKKGYNKPQAQGLKVGRKKGKKTGHKGKTRAIEEPTHIVIVETDKNPTTGNTNIEETGEYEDITITDFKIVKVVTLYKCKEYIDLDTGETFFANHPDIPEKGIFGKNVLAFANKLHFEHRVVFDGIADIFTNVFDIPMTSPTAWDLCNRVADKVSHAYDDLKQKLRESKIVYGDETGSNKNGVQQWLWGFFTVAIAFFVFYFKRGGNIVEKTLGNKFRGILGCDGWSTYKAYSTKHGILLQRCWAHLIREVKDICKDVDGLHDAYIWICDIFEKVKRARKIKYEKVRKRKYNELVEELNRWIQVYSSRPKMRDLITLVKNGKEFWYTCVLHPKVEPTNNRAENGLRKYRILEKIMGCLRSDQGQTTTEIMMSLIYTWKLQGLNPYNEIRNIL